jgi:amino acid transporter
LVRLAEGTSLITLVIFGLVNAALIRLQADSPAGEGVFRTPRWVPVAGLLVCVGMVCLRLLWGLDE